MLTFGLSASKDIVPLNHDFVVSAGETLFISFEDLQT